MSFLSSLAVPYSMILAICSVTLVIDGPLNPLSGVFLVALLVFIKMFPGSSDQSGHLEIEVE